MADLRSEKAHREAAEWLGRLGRSVVAQDELARFRTWRMDAGNDQAFQEVQATWRLAGTLSGDPDIQRALNETARRRILARTPVMIGLGLAGAAGALVVTIVSLPRPDTYVTQIGERSVIHLADGSTVQLDTDSRLRASLTRGARNLELQRGQALFQVAHDAGRPFVVTAGTLQVTATGTLFDVRRTAGAEPKVVLLSGQVIVRATGRASPQRWTLRPGQEVSSTAAQPRTLAAAEDRTTSWTSGLLTFRDAPLAEVVSEANRYSRSRLIISADARLENLRVDGVFAAGDSPALAHALGDLYDLKTEPMADGSLVLSPSEARTPKP